MGEDGTELVNIFNDIEELGTKRYIAEGVNRLAREVRKAQEYDRAIKAALANWTSGIAQGFVEHGAESGFDA